MNALFGTKFEGRSEEFYKNNLWLGQTENELRWYRARRNLFLISMAVVVCGLLYW
jgi:hypothetical protein